MHGSKRICRSPCLIAAYHVLHRLLAPRHPLCALCSLINLFQSFALESAPDQRFFMITETLWLKVLPSNRLFQTQLLKLYFFTTLYVDVKEPALRPFRRQKKLNLGA